MAHWLTHHGLLNLLSNIKEDQLPQSAITHSDIDPPILSNNQETAPQTCPQASAMKAKSWLSLFLSSNYDNR